VRHTPFNLCDLLRLRCSACSVLCSHRVTGDIYFRLGTYEQAANHYQQGLTIAGEHFVALENLYRLGTILAYNNDPTGEGYIHQAIENAESAGLISIAGYARAMLQSVYFVRQQFDSFEQHRNTLEGLTNTHLIPTVTGWLDYLKAEMLFTQGDLDNSSLQVEKTLAFMENCPQIWNLLGMLGLKVRISHQLQKDATGIIAQIQILLNQIGKSIGNAPIQDNWQKFVLKYQ